MIDNLQRAIVRAASWLVPNPQRPDWLAEWRAELWHARRTLDSFAAIRFCLGAFRDGIGLRRDGSQWRMRELLNLDSPARCLGFLAILSAISLLIAFQVPVPPRAPEHQDRGFLFIAILMCLALRVASRELGDHRENRHTPSLATRLRRWLFLAAKIALILSMGYAPMRFMAHAIATDPPGKASPAGLAAQLMWVVILGLRWAFRDQGNRCPVCLQKLANPVRVGQAAGYFLEWNCTEFVCLQGHGMLYVPACHTSWFDTPRWLYLDASWTTPPEPTETEVSLRS